MRVDGLALKEHPASVARVAGASRSFSLSDGIEISLEPPRAPAPTDQEAAETKEAEALEKRAHLAIA